MQYDHFAPHFVPVWGATPVNIQVSGWLSALTWLLRVLMLWAVTKSLLPPAGCAACTARDVVIAAQEAAIAGQQAAVEELQAKVERLERLLSRNSGNSSFPPSMDAQPGRKRPQPRPRRSDGSRAPG